MKKNNNIVNLSQFVNEAGRGRPRKNPKPEDQDQETQQEQPKLKDLIGLDAEENNTDGIYEIEPPTDDDLLDDLDPENMSENEQTITMCFASEKPFFVQGEAGWGKTSIIKKIAHKYGYTICIVYLDKCDVTDLLGMPVNSEDKSGHGYTRYNMPPWAHVIYSNPKTKFLLFLDEMNQADTAVQNACMPIVKERVVSGRRLKNMMVCAAGNFKHENQGGVHDLSIPLESRFGGIITWVSGDWASAMDHLKKKHAKEFEGSSILDKIEKNATLFKNPRDVEDFIIETLVNYKKNYNKIKGIPTKMYLKQLQRIAADDLSQSGEDDLAQLADDCYAFVHGQEDNNGDEREKNILMIPQEQVEAIKDGIIKGWMTSGDESDTKKYGISKENVRELPITEEIGNRESLEMLIDMLEADGIKYRFEKNKDFEEAGYYDPCDDSFDFMITKKTKPTAKDPKTKNAHKKTIKDYLNQ